MNGAWNLTKIISSSLWINFFFQFEDNLSAFFLSLPPLSPLIKDILASNPKFLNYSRFRLRLLASSTLLIGRPECFCHLFVSRPWLGEKFAQHRQRSLEQLSARRTQHSSSVKRFNIQTHTHTCMHTHLLVHTCIHSLVGEAPVSPLPVVKYL